MKIGGDTMTSEFMRDLLTKDEKITVEYKSCQHGEFSVRMLLLRLKYNDVIM